VWEHNRPRDVRGRQENGNQADDGLPEKAENGPAMAMPDRY
jgi:hypothetical protein